MTGESLWRGPVEKLDDAREVDRLVPEHTEVVVFRADSQPCPWVETGDEGTSFCRLAARADSLPAPEQLAQLFHETYERLAPSHGYDTRKATAVPWEQVKDPNRRLMIDTCAEVLALLSGDPTGWSQTRNASDG